MDPTHLKETQIINDVMIFYYSPFNYCNIIKSMDGNKIGVYRNHPVEFEI